MEEAEKWQADNGGDFIETRKGEVKDYSCNSELLRRKSK